MAIPEDTMNTIESIAHEAGENFILYNGDACELVAQMPDNSVDLMIYSPPFANLFTYSDSARDMGNVVDAAQFFEHYRYLLGELLRVLRPGRLAVVHCTDLCAYQVHQGYTGIRDFPGEIIRAHQSVEPGPGHAPWRYHARTTIWKDPVTEMQRSKALGLLWSQLCKDSTRSRMGIPDYLLMFRKGHKAAEVPVNHTRKAFPVEQWQQWASPVWMDIRQTRTLNARIAREAGDERHMCPLQLDVIERIITLYSNEGDVVLSPFGGVGSEGVVALQMQRKAVLCELKPSYYRTAAVNLHEADGSHQGRLFG